MPALRWLLAAPQPGQLRGGCAGLGLWSGPCFGDTSTAEGARRVRGSINMISGPVTGHVGHHLGSRGNPHPLPPVMSTFLAMGGKNGGVGFPHRPGRLGKTLDKPKHPPKMPSQPGRVKFKPMQALPAPQPSVSLHPSIPAVHREVRAEPPHHRLHRGVRAKRLVPGPRASWSELSCFY